MELVRLQSRDPRNETLLSLETRPPARAPGARLDRRQSGPDGGRKRTPAGFPAPVQLGEASDLAPPPRQESGRASYGPNPVQQDPIARILARIFADTSVKAAQVVFHVRCHMSPPQPQSTYQFPLCGVSSSGEGEPVIERCVCSSIIRLQGSGDPSGGGVPHESRGDGVARVMIGSKDGIRRTVGRSVFQSRIAPSLHSPRFAATETNLSENSVRSSRQAGTCLTESAQSWVAGCRLGHEPHATQRLPMQSP